MDAAPETCAHNLHRDPDPGEDGPQPTDLCRNAIGAFHMLDCPLFLGGSCAHYEEAPAPHAVTADADIAATRALLRRDFLRWPYRVRVRSLAGDGALPERLLVESVPEPEEEPGEDIDFALAGSDELPEPEPEPEEEAAPHEELYPGQRRSEDLRKPRKRPIPASGEGAEPAGEPGEERSAPESSSGDAPEEAEGVAADVEAEIEAGEPAAPEEREPDRPKSLDEVFDVLPEAPDLPEKSRAGRRGSRSPRGQRGPRRPGRRRSPRPRDGAPPGEGKPSTQKPPAGDKRPGDKPSAAKPAKRRRRRRRRPSGGGPAKPSE